MKHTRGSAVTSRDSRPVSSEGRRLRHPLMECPQPRTARYPLRFQKATGGLEAAPSCTQHTGTTSSTRKLGARSAATTHRGVSEEPKAQSLWNCGTESHLLSGPHAPLHYPRGRSSPAEARGQAACRADLKGARRPHVSPLGERTRRRRARGSLKIKGLGSLEVKMTLGFLLCAHSKPRRALRPHRPQ